MKTEQYNKLVAALQRIWSDDVALSNTDRVDTFGTVVEAVALALDGAVIAGVPLNSVAMIREIYMERPPSEA